MKTFLLAIIILISITGVYGQKCKYISNTVSGMDGTHLVITYPEVFTKKSELGSVSVWAKLHLDSVIVLSIVLNGDNPIAVTKNDSIILSQNNNELLCLKIMQDASRNLNSTKSLTIYTVLSKADYDVVESANINLIQLQTAGGWINIKADNKKKSKSLLKVLTCVAVFLED